MKTVTAKNLKNGHTVYILTTDGAGKHWLTKRLIGPKTYPIEQARRLAAAFSRAPMWYSRRKALSHLKLYEPMRLP